MNPTLEDLEENYAQLEKEVKKIKAIIEASDTSTFEIFIEQIKEEMIDNIKEEDFKTLKQNKLKIEKFREIIKIIQNQTKLLETKTAVMNDLKWKIDHFQQSLPLQIEEEKAHITNHEFCGEPIRTGDVFKNKTKKEVYYLVKTSDDIKGSFALISNSFDGERCLQYPNNLKILENADFIDNIFSDDCDNEAMRALSIIANSQEVQEATAEG